MVHKGIDIVFVIENARVSLCFMDVRMVMDAHGVF